jgi:hypothetical protein
MTKRWWVGPFVIAITAAHAWAAEPTTTESGAWRNPKPERVSVSFAAGGLIALGDFDDAANSGAAIMAIAHYRASQWVQPVVSFQWAFLEADEAADRGDSSLDALNFLFGVRGYLLPDDQPFRPYLTVLGGWARYMRDDERGLPGLIATGEDHRDDPAISPGGGFEVVLHPNVSVGMDGRALFSFATGDSKEEDDVTAVSLSGFAAFHF